LRKIKSNRILMGLTQTSGIADRRCRLPEHLSRLLSLLERLNDCGVVQYAE